MEKVVDVSDVLQVNPDDLMSVMAFESWLNPSQRNIAGGSAVGLIQFMPNTAIDLGTTSEELVEMTGTEQLAYVEKFYLPYAGEYDGIEDLYGVTLKRSSINLSNDDALYRAGTAQYTANKGLDTNNDGIITKTEAAQVVYTRREEYGLIP